MAHQVDQWRENMLPYVEAPYPATSVLRSAVLRLLRSLIEIALVTSPHNTWNLSVPLVLRHSTHLHHIQAKIWWLLPPLASLTGYVYDRLSSASPLSPYCYDSPSYVSREHTCIIFDSGVAESPSLGAISTLR